MYILHRTLLIALLMACALAFGNFSAQAQTPTVITYQGRLTDQNAPATGQYDLRFIVYTQDIGGAQQGSIATLDNVMVTDGVFTVQLDFGGTAPFISSTGLFIETSIRPGASGGAYTILSPRQPLTATPYAVKAVNAESATTATTATTATNATQLGGVAAANYVQTTDTRLADARSPVAGSASYIQNTTNQQVAEFNISGNGAAGGTLSGGVVKSQTEYLIGNDRVLGIGNVSTFVGRHAGNPTTTGFFNSFVGGEAGSANTTGSNNTFVGVSAGTSNQTGGSNSFFGAGAGAGNTTGGSNSFTGTSAGLTNTTGSNNTLVGASADVTSGNLTNATAIGAGAKVATSNTVVIGTSNNAVRVPGKLVVLNFGATGSTAVCRNASNELSTCSSSLRYKTDITPFYHGLNLVKRLRPITFEWKDGGMLDLGLGAEDVAAIEPLLATYNERGEVEGVKYDRIGVVLLNAVREQQTQIATLQSRLTTETATRAKLERRLAALEQYLARRASR